MSRKFNNDVSQKQMWSAQCKATETDMMVSREIRSNTAAESGTQGQTETAQMQNKESGGTSFMAEERNEETEERTEGKGYTLSDELDENGIPFIISSDGSTTFGEIGAETGLTPAPIKLSEGEITDPETNEGYGLVHIEARHGEQIRKAGYKDVVSFIEDVARNWQRIRKGNKYGESQSYLLELKDKHNNTLIVELSRDKGYWNINTAGIFNEGYSRRKEEVFSRPAATNQPTTTGEVTQSATQNGSEVTETSRDNTHNASTSENKGSENSGTSKENGENSQFSAEESVATADKLMLNLRTFLQQ